MNNPAWQARMICAINIGAGSLWSTTLDRSSMAGQSNPARQAGVICRINTGAGSLRHARLNVSNLAGQSDPYKQARVIGRLTICEMMRVTTSDWNAFYVTF